jgi:dihydropteroate synthase
MTIGAKPDHPFGATPVIMGIVNVTPDSFSDGGKFINYNKAVENGLRLVQEGAQILDIGGESTRPGAETLDIQQEIDRVMPVIEKLKGAAPFISIDTRNAATMRAAVKSGANIINDISALTYDSSSLGFAAEAGMPVFLMHMQGTPQNMQENPQYNNVIEDVYNFLNERISVCEKAGIKRKNIVIDPGIGFGKTLEHNVLLIRNIKRFHDLGRPILLGASRKSFIASLGRGEPPISRLGGSIASAIWGLNNGVHIFRVHDVLETRQAFETYRAISEISP